MEGGRKRAGLAAQMRIPVTSGWLGALSGFLPSFKGDTSVKVKSQHAGMFLIVQVPVSEERECFGTYVFIFLLIAGKLYEVTLTYLSDTQ